MGKIFRWIGYASTLVGAILIIWACIGGCHHKCASVNNEKASVCCKHQPNAIAKTDSMQHSSCANAAVKKDSVNCKQQSSCTAASAKAESGCCKSHTCCSNACAMNANCCHKCNHGNLFSAANSFLLLAIALFIISKHCCCKKCCNENEGKCEPKEGKKE